MKIQELAIIFVIIILPISLLLSEYTQFQIQTLKTQTEYDSKLTAATYDAIKAFQLNSTNSTESGLANSEMRDLTASVNTFRNSLMSTFKLNGYTEEELNSYIPALVYTLYDGFYLYSPYQNENHRYEIALDGDGNQRIDHITGEVLEYVQDGAGNDLKIDGNGEKLYGVKPYISYSCRYIKGNTDVVITYALDNHITVQGMIGDSYVNRSGYLIEIDDTGTSEFGIYYKQEDEDTEIVKYNGEIINEEHLKEFLPLRNANPDDDASETCIYSYAKINGIKYYLIPQYYEVKDYDGNTIGYKDCIVYLFNGDPIIQAKRGDERFGKYEEWITKNGTAKKYYKDAYFFTKWLQEDSGLRFLRYEDAYDEVINTDPNDGITDGQIELKQLWPGNETRIFKFNDGGPNSKSIETEFSNFNQHRLAVIRKKIEINLAIAISNYNSYSNVNNMFQIPQLKETEWDSITHNIALISFMQGLPIGGKIYNGYSIVTNSESDKVVFEENIYILSDNADSPSGQKTYCRIGDEDLETPTSGKYSNDTESDPPKSAGRLNLDFERSKVIANGEMTYYYPLPEYNASYNSVVMQDNVKTYDDIYEYIESPEKTDIAQAFYTALARERGGLYVPFEDIIDSPSYDDDFGNPDIDEWVKITYHLKDETNSTIEEDVKVGVEIQLKVPYREGYEFLGWAVNPNATEAYYKKDTEAFKEYTPVDDRSLYAVWILEEYTITYDANGGTNVPTAQIKQHGVDIPLTLLPIPTRDGYIFKGWATTSNATIAEYQPGNLFGINANTTLYAIWEPDIYEITYDANGGIGAPEAQQKTHGEGLILSSTQPTRDGHKFIGWATSSSATEAQYQPGGTYTENADITLYAVWEVKTYTVTYDANGGTLVPEVQTKTHGIDLTLIILTEEEIPTRTGYEFIGWAETKTATTATYKPGDQYKDNKDIKLYAVWKPHTYIVEYNANGGSGAPEAQTKKHGDDLTLSTTKPTRTGYIFEGWAESSTATVTEIKYQPGDTYKANAPITLYAVWKPDTYTVTYNANGGIGAPGEQIKKHGEDLILSSTIPTRDGYDFKGWAEKSTATSAKYQPGDTYSNDANTTLYAVWKLKTYNVTYDANGGTGAPTAQTKTHGKVLTLSSVRPEREGYKFKGWAESSTATSATYQPGGKYTENKETILYAVWELNTYIIEYNANGGTGAPAAQTKTHGQDLILSSTQPTREGHNFMGWAETSTETSAKYQPGETYSKDGNATLYAVWEAKKYPVIYNANGGSEAPESQEKIYAVDLKLSEKIPVRTGHTFIGWGQFSDATSPSYNPGDIYKTNAPITLYAIWEIDVYTVIYDANEGTGAPEKQFKKHGEDLILSSTQPTREGYNFIGWAENSTETTAKYQSGGKYTTDANTTLYAVWEIKTYNVTYNANGGSGAPDTQIKTHGIDLTLSTTIPIRTGYTFKGWGTSANTTKPKYQPGENYTENKELSLYAVWEINTYTVTYNANGGIGAPEPQTKTHGKDLTLSDVRPTKEGYVFKGWGESAISTSAKYQPEDKYTTNANIELYAVWQKAQYVITYDANEGSGAPEPQNKIHGESLTLSSTKPTRDGYNFMGWAETSTETTAKYQPEGTYSKDGNATLYAVWKAKTYTVKYNANGGSGVPVNQTKTHDVELTLSTSPIPTRTGHEFKGWATSSTATSAKYQPGGNFTENRNVTLYAVWAKEQYVITFEGNGGTFSGGATQMMQTVSYGGKLTPKPTREGYLFRGWDDSPEATKIVYEYEEIYYGTTNITLYAVWEANIYTIHYDANGGTGEPDDQIKIQDEELTLSSVKPTRDGYNFMGWSESSTATSATYQPGGKYTDNKQATLYAVWELKTYTVKYNANKGTEAPDEQTKKHGEDLILTSEQPTREGHSFKGWATSSNATIAKYQPGDTYKENGNATLYAVWEVNKYPVIYDANGGSGAPDAQEKIHAVDLTLSETIPVRIGYTFIGWAETSTATVTEIKYQPGDTYKTNAQITLYAIWEIDVYTVTYNANGGSGEPANQIKTHGVDMILSTIVPTREGYNFMGWAETSTATVTEIKYQPGGTYSNDVSTTLYAVWELKTYEVKYDANKGSGAPGVQIKTHGVDMTLSTIVPTRDGHNFKGWAESATATSAKYQPGGDFKENKEVTLYAVWEVKTYTVTYNANGGIGEPSNQTKTHGNDLKLSSTVPTREGYDFKGWAENPDDEAAKYQPGETYSNDANTTLYAVWELKTYTITYDANGGNGAPEAQTKTHGEDLDISLTKPNRTGYTFKGWATTSNATIAKYQPGDKYTENISTTLYAVWGTAQSVITFEGNGGTFSGGKTQIKETVIYGDKLTPKPTREGHVFKGWDESPEAINVVYKYEDPYYGSEDATLYAVWEANIYMIQYNANGGNGKPEMQKKVHGIALTLSSDVPTKDGYIFKCWETSSGITYQPGGIFEINAHTTLYAVWESNTYKVTYDANEGTGAPAAQTKIHGVDLTLSSTIPTRTGYRFKGWSASSSTTTAGYPAGGTYQLDQDILLYAVWESMPYSIIFDTNGGAFSDGTTTRSATIHYGSAIISDIPIREGHQFLGWAESATSSEAEYAPGAYYYGTTDIKLYAVWLAGTYTVTYDANGGSGAPAAQTKTHGVDLTLSTTIPTRTGYTFKGWSASATSTGIGYTAGGTYKLNQDILLFAVWQADTYKVTYNANGGTGEPAAQTKTHGVDLELSTTKPTRTGYTFKGWKTSSGVTYQPGAIYKTNASITLYAVWQANTYSVTYKANGGSGVPASQTKTHDVVLTLSSSPIPTRTGYTFKGWAKSSSATSATHQPGGKYTDNQSVTFYAVWESNPYVITYDTNGGAFSNGTTTRNATVHYGAALTSDIPTQVGYKFLGWAESATATVVKYEAGAHYYQAKDTTLYAVWEKVETCTITYDKNGGIWTPNYSGPQSEVVVKGEKTKMSTHSLFYVTLAEGGSYKFIGWNTDKTAKVAEYLDGGYITITEDTTLYAIWKWVPKTYTVTYDANGGEGVPENQTKTHGVTLTLSSTSIPTREGYIFKGWATSSSATEAEYQPGDTYSTNASATLYAVWGEPETYTITFDPNGGYRYIVDADGNVTASIEPFSQIVVEGENIKKVQLATRIGFIWSGGSITGSYTYKLDGWKDVETGELYSGDAYTNIIPTKDMQFIAVWSKP